MSETRSLSRASLVTELQAAIKELIYAQQLAPGDPLPSEHDLCEALGVSRNSLREALKVLEATGVVSIQRGRGMFVGAMSLNGFINELVFHARVSAASGTEELRHLVELREHLEASLMATVISAATASQLKELEELVRRMAEAELGAPETLELDRRFHEVLYEELGNPLVSQLLGAFWEVFRVLAEQVPGLAGTAGDTADIHRAILTAIVRADATEAVESMSSHFAGIKARLGSPPQRRGARPSL